jgi:Flp pilus assembly pilin Flp
VAVERGQASVETAALWGLVALLLLIAAALLGGGLADTIVHALGSHLPHARRGSRFTPDELALRNPRLRMLIDRALPRLVLERDDTHDDDEVPVWTSCRHPLCARAGRAAPVLHVHVVHTASGPVVEIWTYYPDSQTSHLPVAALRGYHHDDWEGLLVAFAADGTLRGARASAHIGFNGTAPWWEQAANDWAPYSGVVYRASGSHALGFKRSDLDLAGDAWNGDLATVEPGSFRLVAADRLAQHGLTFDPEVSPPWDKAAWRNPGTRHTGTAAAGRSRVAEAARVWAEAYALGAW